MTVAASQFARSGQTIFVVEPTPDGVFLYALRADGFAGDTWHLTVEDAQAQAAHSAGQEVGPWRSIPAGIEDKIAFAKANG